MPAPSCLRAALTLSAAVILTTASHTAFGQSAVSDLYRAELIAELRDFEHFEYPAQVRQLRADTEQAAAEVAAFRRLEHEYHGIARFDRGNPLPVSRELIRLERLAAEARLRELKTQKITMQRRRTVYLRRLALQLLEAESRSAGRSQ